MATVNVVFTRESEDGRRWLDGVQVVGRSDQVRDEPQIWHALDSWATQYTSRIVGFRVVDDPEAYSDLLGGSHVWQSIMIDWAGAAESPAGPMEQRLRDLEAAVEDVREGLRQALAKQTAEKTAAQPKADEDRMAQRCLMLATPHLTKDDYEALRDLALRQAKDSIRTGEQPGVVVVGSGYFIPYVSRVGVNGTTCLADDKHIPECDFESEMPSLRSVLIYARELKCEMVYINSEADAAPGLPIYEW